MGGDRGWSKAAGASLGKGAVRIEVVGKLPQLNFFICFFFAVSSIAAQRLL